MVRTLDFESNNSSSKLGGTYYFPFVTNAIKLIDFNLLEPYQNKTEKMMTHIFKVLKVYKDNIYFLKVIDLLHTNLVIICGSMV